MTKCKKSTFKGHKKVHDRQILLDQIQERNLIGYEKEFQQIYGEKIDFEKWNFFFLFFYKCFFLMLLVAFLDLVDHTVSTGGSNSVLLLGPPGVGKTLLIENVLKKVKEESKIFRDDGIVVRMSGLVEIDDKMALKEITRQLNLTMVVGDKVFGSFSQHLEFLLNSLRSGNGRQSKAILFILDQFELFTTHHNQTLLYNLFDVAQSKAAPIIVIGISSHFDVVESLEKRVKSRFNHRQVAMMPLPDFNAYLEVIIHFLNHDEASNQWTKAVMSLVQDHSVKNTFKSLHAINNTIGYLKHFLTVCLSLLDDDDEVLTTDHVVRVFQEQCEVSEKVILKGLSVLEICVLVAVKHVLDIYQDQPFNFEMAFHEYDKFATRKAKMFRYDRPVVMKAWEALQDLEIITPLDKGTKVQKEFKLCTLQVLPDVIMSVVEASMPLSVKEWAVSVSVVE